MTFEIGKKYITEKHLKVTTKEPSGDFTFPEYSIKRYHPFKIFCKVVSYDVYWYGIGSLPRYPSVWTTEAEMLRSGAQERKGMQ
jgi:hypothetical protein